MATLLRRQLLLPPSLPRRPLLSTLWTLRTLDHLCSASSGPMQEFMAKHELHSLAQETARMHGDLQQHQADTVKIVDKLNTKAVAHSRDIATAIDRLDQVELSVVRTKSTLETIREGLKTLITRVNALAPPPILLPCLLLPFCAGYHCSPSSSA
ncbi:hypothetical protein B0H13DRAFT_2306715 [Mycena leptocephala]|nr:hypothetical protein B0H13DRAFT_2306715 [Mycena leptocephala]